MNWDIKVVEICLFSPLHSLCDLCFHYDRLRYIFFIPVISVSSSSSPFISDLSPFISAHTYFIFVHFRFHLRSFPISSPFISDFISVHRRFHLCSCLFHLRYWVVRCVCKIYHANLVTYFTIHVLL